MRKLSFIILLLSISITISAEGYQVNLQSNRQTGMGHTGAGQSLGATSIHFNPGAMGMMNSQFDFSAGGSAVLSSNSFEAGGIKEESDNPTGTPFYVYAAGKLTDNLVAGIGVTSPFGNSLKWGDEWRGRYLIQDISLQAIFVQPTLSYRITDCLSLGAGMSVVFGAVDMNRAISFQALDPFYQQATQNPSATAPDGQVNLKGNSVSFGYSAGLYYQISEKLSVGLGYRSKVEIELDGGDATFTHDEQIPTFLNMAMAMQGVNLPDNYLFFPDNKFSSMLPMPANLTLGVGWQASDKWFFAVDLQNVRWSAYKSLDFDFEQNTVTVEDSSMPKNFENTMIYRFGAEYALNPSVLLRAGVYYDETPIKDQYLTPETPGTNKTGLSFGFSWFINEGLSVDASILHIMGEERDSTMPLLPGTYNTSAWIPGIGLSYKF
ncbi:OmpP1/FadL family transporter [Alkalitalea saponilacus]|nr:outer membrane protein transport protein [Alkalitalea saponilacus]ASB51204.1 hydrocarbon degradation protein [Alkalitalea saponilacus]